MQCSFDLVSVVRVAARPDAKTFVSYAGVTGEAFADPVKGGQLDLFAEYTAAKPA